MNQNTKHFYAHVAQTSDFPLGIEVESASGIYIQTKDGRQILDFISGIAVSSLGHRHQNVVDAIKSQVDKHLHVMVYGEFIQAPQSELAALLTSQTCEHLDRVYFVNSGTEANEGALKLAKKATGRTKLVALKNSYHGDSHGSLSVTGRDIYRDPYLPLLPDVHFINQNVLDDLKIIDSKTAAVIIEPIQGEGGIKPSDSFWLKSLRERCNQVGALLIYDEIQSGFGRTGKLFAYQHYGIAPDILTLAKAMGGGMPIGAFLASSKLFEHFKNNPPLNHVTTFGGHPVSCAASLATLKTLLSEKLMENAQLIETHTKQILRGKGIVEVRGIGAMLGLELVSKELTQNVVERAFSEHQILLGWTLHSNTLIRLAPPLIISEDTLIFVLDTLKEIIREEVDKIN